MVCVVSDKQANGRGWVGFEEFTGNSKSDAYEIGLAYFVGGFIVDSVDGLEVRKMTACFVDGS